MKEKQVLASAIQSNEAYSAIADHVEHSDLSEQGWIIWQGITKYYDADPSATHCDIELLQGAVARLVSADKHKEMFRELVATVGAADCSPANVVTDLLATKREVVGHELANALLTGHETQRLMGDYQDLLGQTAFDDADETETRQGYSVEGLCEEGFSPEGLIQVWPLSLNKRLDGGLKPGHHVVLFARPEMGKTMTVIDMIAGFLHQGLKVLYVGNEDPINDINMRVVNRLSGMNKFEVLNNPKEADRKVRDAGYDLLIMAALSPGSTREITQLIEKHEPEVLVIDQLRNLNMHNDNFVLSLDEAAKSARTWAKRYSCVVVSVTQAGDSASGKSVLDMGDVDFSNTGIPATADLMIGLGANERNLQRGEIVFSLPKNKVSGKHEYFAVLTEPQLSQLIPLD
jgi:archaellum biogenesis ATPase FlaH